MAGDNVKSGYWSQEQADYHKALMNPAPAQMDPRSDPVQSRPSKPPRSTPKFGTRKRGS